MTAHVDLSMAGPLASSPAATVTLLAPVARFSLRAGEAAQAKLSTALGIQLPTQIGQCERKGDTELLCLSPNEWVIIAPETQAETITTACATVYGDAAHSLTEISDREITVRIDGPKAAELMTLGSPRDLDKLPAGEARRTIFDGATVVLWRDEAQAFRLDIWRSFAPHVISLLQTGCVELAAEQ